MFWRRISSSCSQALFNYLWVLSILFFTCWNFWTDHLETSTRVLIFSLYYKIIIIRLPLLHLISEWFDLIFLWIRNNSCKWKREYLRLFSTCLPFTSFHFIVVFFLYFSNMPKYITKIELLSAFIWNIYKPD